MINTYLKDRRYFALNKLDQRTKPIYNLVESRNLFSIQNVDYDILTVTSLDIDEGRNFMLVGLSNGAVDLKEVEDSQYGILSQIFRFNCSQFNVNRVQWSPGEGEQFFSLLDNHVLYLVDPIENKILDKYGFNLKTNWSEWNPSDRKMIAICGSESQVRLVDIRSGSSVQTVILGAPSRLATHRATRCLWSNQDLNCLIVGDNEGFIHIYDTRHSTRSLLIAGEECGQISGMSFTKDNCSIITSQGTENHLVHWTYDKCSLISHPHKFKKRKKSDIDCSKTKEKDIRENYQLDKLTPGSSSCNTSIAKSNRTPSSGGKSKDAKRNKKRNMSLPVDAYIRCQFHVTDQHIYCPVPPSTKKSKELYVYDIESGIRVKTLKSDNILSQGVFSVTSLIPESLVIYVGGRGRLRSWTLDEGYQRKLVEKMHRYHRTIWDSDDDT